jgi:hypothetical protein
MVKKRRADKRIARKGVAMVKARIRTAGLVCSWRI